MNISDITLKTKQYNIVTEEDVKIKIAIPILEKLGYFQSDMEFEKNIEVFYGRKKAGIKSDIIVNIVYENKKTPVMAVEVKSPKKRLGEMEKEQAISYARLHTPPIKFAVITNGNEWKIFHTGTKKRIKGGVPSVSEFLSAKYDLSERQIEESKKFVVEGYKTATEIIKALEKCHNIMRSNDGFTPLDAFDEMIKLIYAKTQAEKREGNKFTKKYFEKECAAIKNGKTQIDYDKVKKEMGRIFEDAIEDYQYNEKLFDKKDKIEICPESVYEIVQILDNKGFIQTDYEIIGYAFENFLSTVFRGERLGQYFTPRQIVDFAIDMIDVNIGDKIIDPCFGSGGFLVAAFKILRERIKNGDYNEEKEKKEIKTLCEESLFGTDINKRLSIACKINMYIHGDGRTEIYHNDGLLDNKHIKENSFDKIFTNPPFGSKIGKQEILKKFKLAGAHRKMLRSEVLFLERCINLLKQDGEMAIVLPDIILNGANNKKTRGFIFDNCQILAIVSLPAQTFVKSGASVKTSLLFLKKKPLSKICSNKIFMAIPEKVGFDSAGREEESQLGKIIDRFEEFKKGNDFEQGEIIFTVLVKNIADRIDPKVYRPQKKINTEFKIVKLKELIQEKTEKIKPQNFSKTLFTVLGVNNNDGVFVNKIEQGKNLKQPHYLIEKNDFCYNPARINIGAIGLNKLEGQHYIITGYYRVFKVDETRIIPEFLFNLFDSENFLRFVKENVAGAVRMDLKIDDLKTWQIPLPSLEYQKILLQKINRQKETAAAMDVAIKNFVEIEEDIFEGFEKVELKELIKIKKQTIEPQKNKDMEFHYIGLEHIEKNSGTIFKKEIVKGKNLASAKNLFKKGDILYGKLRPNLNKLYLSDFDGICSTDILVFEANKEKIASAFLIYVLLRKNFVKEVSEKMSGANLPRIKIGELKAIKIPLPSSLEIQNNIVKKFDERFEKVKIFKETKEEAQNNRKKIIENIFK